MFFFSLLLFLLPITASRTLRTLHSPPKQRSIEELVAAETRKVSNVASTKPVSSNNIFDPAACIINGRINLDAVTEVGSRMIRKRNFRASHDCFKIALQSWYAGVQQRPAAYIGKIGANQKELQTALKQLQFQGVPGLPGSAPTTNTNSDLPNDLKEDRPQIPPQLLYLHKLHASQEAEAEAATQLTKSKETTNDNIIRAPRMVEERKQQQEQQQQKIDAVKVAAAAAAAAAAIVTPHTPAKPMLTPSLQTSNEQLLHELALETKTFREHSNSNSQDHQHSFGPYRII